MGSSDKSVRNELDEQLTPIHANAVERGTDWESNADPNNTMSVALETVPSEELGDANSRTSAPKMDINPHVRRWKNYLPVENLQHNDLQNYPTLLDICQIPQAPLKTSTIEQC